VLEEAALTPERIAAKVADFNDYAYVRTHPSPITPEGRNLDS
jgi:hypothetical protein